jgi:hypothetical protein
MLWGKNISNNRGSAIVVDLMLQSKLKEHLEAMDFMAVCYMSQIPINFLYNANIASRISDIQITLETQVEN